MIQAQGGDASVIEQTSGLPQAATKVPLAASAGGFVQEVDAMRVALAVLRLGGGRARTSDTIDLAVGVTELVKTGERVEAGAALCRIHANDDNALREATSMLGKAIVIGERAPMATNLVEEIIGS
jgi:thymidine phosphorylase